MGTHPSDGQNFVSLSVRFSRRQGIQVYPAGKQDQFLLERAVVFDQHPFSPSRFDAQAFALFQEESYESPYGLVERPVIRNERFFSYVMTRVEIH